LEIEQATMKHALTVACNPGTGVVSDIAEIKGVRSLFTTR
jgi:hypothetical protein